MDVIPSTDFGHTELSHQHLRTCSSDGDKDWFHNFHSEREFGIMESVHEICVKAANNGAQAIPEVSYDMQPSYLNTKCIAVPLCPLP